MGNTLHIGFVDRWRLGGSPPHAWGIPLLAEQWLAAIESAVHPHMRGEYITCSLSKSYLSTRYGSPPHAWGIRRCRRCCGLGSTVHPHMRGEYFAIFSHYSSPLGSPPHAWGILVIAVMTTCSLRFTPTCVGNTGESGYWCGAAPVHPHMRGEYMGIFTTPGTFGGSPPHAWGIRI